MGHGSQTPVPETVMVEPSLLYATCFFAELDMTERIDTSAQAVITTGDFVAHGKNKFIL
jgi:hypothetical protein